ncbi:hypothetical protein TSUD_215650 [Trifolium subterraneum]|uniref:Uncharacterized protein n=1 Tax=Trifolium subterraneum TaxID=3900 RepID=A0A2Z6M5U2_TRISU|nr:hypothetical protein TSUD_215650 [Trifolium subterraneum]
MERITGNDGGSGMNLQAAVGEINRLKAKMTAMEQEKVAEKEKEREEEAELDNIQDSQPLAQALWDAQVPANFKIPQLPTFEGKTDPLEHLMVVGTQTVIIGAEEHLKCKLLSSTLKDAALRWYMNLPKNSIASYTDFHKKFIHQFAGSKHVRVTATSLFGIRQGHNENLPAVQNGLKAGHFNESLAQKPASTMQEVMKRAECYIKGEESNAEKRSRDSREKPSSRRSPERYNRGSSQRSGRYEDKGGGRYRQPWRSNERTYRAQEEYTELNDSKVHVLDEILSSGLAKLPLAPDNNARMGANENAWCHYHRAKGHDTENATAKGDLNKRSPPRSPRRSPPREDDEKEPKRIAVNTIAGGFVGGGESKAARKRYLRRIIQETNTVAHVSSSRAPEISFSLSDGEGVFPHDDDPLVIQVQILNCDVKRVLIDSGSSADIISLQSMPQGPVPATQHRQTDRWRLRLQNSKLHGHVFRYNQIKMNTLDAPHTTFMSNTCNYHYTVMPFGLKNADATYQRLMDRVFAHQIGKNLEMYIDDMVVKTTSKGEHHEDLKDILASVRKYNMRLNPAKCSFRVQAGKFLGFLLTNRGIEANPEKCQAIMDMRSPTSVKEVQQLTWRITALSRSLSCVGEKAFHFFATLKSSERFTWSDKCEEAFQQLKVFLASPPILTRPQLGCPLYLIFRGAEIRYQKIEKLSLAVVTTARRLRHYFQSHKIVVKTDHPIKHVLKKPDLAGRMVAWAVQLSEYDITFVPRGNIKSQILEDFILELSSPPEATNMQPWTLSVDGASNIRGSGAGVVLEGPDGVLIEQSLRFAFKASNNQAEYEALIAGMRLAKKMEVADLRAKSDSQLVTSQVSGEFQAKDPQLIKYLEQVRSLAKHFNTFELIYVPREQNARADLLSKLASTKKPGNNRTIIQETVTKPSTGNLEVWMVTRNDDWRTPIIQYLENEKLPEEKEEKVKIKKMAAHYTMVGGELYKRGFSSPMLLCVGETKSRRILNEIHNGSCGSHIGGRSLAGKVTRAGFFWPTLLSDANRHVRSCDQCQRHAYLHHAPGELLQSVMSPWPFYMWGVDILGPFTTSQGQAKFLLVAVDYFTKWIKAEPVATISSERVKKFYWKNILCRFGIPKYIVSDNGTQFTSESVINFYQEKGIRNTFISVEHPQANGQAESANKVILKAIKRRLEGKDKNWVEHLLPTLWSYHTTIHSSTGETPFKMVYGVDAMIPAEVDPPSWRRATLTAEVNSEALKENLDLLEEVRETAHFREFTAKQRASRKYNTRVMAREFREGDLVLKRLMGRNKGGKLAPNWEGPYMI